jgi:phosphate uptake regulator
MRRKLVKQGAATMMISLPAKWIKENSLKKGSEIDLEQADNNLLVSAKPIEEVKKEITIKLANLTESSIRTLITNTYRRGYDIINVNFDNEKQFKILNQIIKTKLIGFDVTKKEKNSCIVESITEPSTDQFDTIIKKIFYNISELFEITKKRMQDKKEVNNYIEVEERIMKYDNFCRRVISKRKIINPKSEFLWTFLALLIHGQREIYHLNKLLGIKVSDKIKELLEDAKSMFGLIMHTYLEKNIELLSKVHSLEKELIYKKGYSLLKKTKEGPIVYHIMLAIREFYQANSPLSGLIM